MFIYLNLGSGKMVSCRYSLKTVLEQCGYCSIFLMLLLLLSMLDGFKLEGILFDVKNGQSKKWLRKVLDGFKHFYNEKDHQEKEFGDGDGVQICFQWNHTCLVSCLRSDAGSNFLEHVEPILGQQNHPCPIWVFWWTELKGNWPKPLRRFG